MDKYCLILTLPWIVFFNPSAVIESFVGSSRLGWSLRVYRIPVQALLDFRVSIERAGIIPIGLTSNVIWFNFFSCSF